ncbi:MAG: helix-hairpin-helix domain-containing protein [Eubacterium sp.]
MDKGKFYIGLIVILLNVVLSGCGSEENIIALSTENHDSDKIKETVIEETSGQFFVYVSGAVKKPGVYCVSSNSRIYQVIDMAGGMTDKAQKDYLNLAEKVFDGQKIQVITKKQFRELNSKSVEGTKTDMESMGADLFQADMVNINHATAEQLTSLPGIGTTKAAAIVAYRDENGNFSSIEDIKNVSGIGDATFANIESRITVN